MPKGLSQRDSGPAMAGRPPGNRPPPRLRPRWAVPVLAIVLACALGGFPAALSAEGGKARVTVKGAVFSVDVVETPAAQSRGLGGRARLASGEGMLFLYASKERRSFWMKAMLISIDIIWLENRRVVHIEHNVPPPARGTRDWDLPTYAPTVPANGVLEIAAGRARALGLRVGDLIGIRLGAQG